MDNRRLEGLDLNLLLTLHWVLTEHSVSRAADRLGVSQPAVSHGLKRLRELFGDPLLVKSGKMMHPTPRAEKLAPEVARMVDDLRELFQTAASFDPASATGRFRVAAVDSWTVLTCAAWRSHVAPHAPGLSLDCVAVDFPVAQDLISGAVDLVIIPETKLLQLPPGIDVEQFVQKPITHDPYLTGWGPAQLAAAEGDPMAAFLEADHVLVNPARASLGIVDEILAERGLARRIRYYTESFLAGCAVAAETGALITAPRSGFAAFPFGLTPIAPPFEVPGFDMLFGWHPNWTNDARHRWVREALLAGLAQRLAAAELA
jgi:DNA-binding transcriptional LysR family regulator